MLYVIHRSIRFLCGWIPVLSMVAAYHWLMRKTPKYRPLKSAAAHVIAVHLFCLYLLSVFSVTDLPDLFHWGLEPSINLVPFDDIFTNTAQYFLNILLFLPFGFLLPLLYQKFERVPVAFAWGALLSLFIELTQLFNYRATDIDDLLMNAAGAVIGCLLFRWTKSRRWSRPVFSADDALYWGGEPIIYVLFVLLSVFILQPVLSSWLLGVLFRGRVVIG